MKNNPKNGDPRNRTIEVSPAVQRRLRRDGLLADSHERWDHPSGRFYLDALPSMFNAKRRLRSDRPTKVRTEQMKAKRAA